jgi:hypothetical protein
MEVLISLGENFLKKYQRYLLVVLVFLGTIFLHYFTVSPEIEDNNNDSEEEVSTKNPDLDGKRREKHYQEIFQSLPGDTFRVGALMTSKKQEVVEIFVGSPLEELNKIGEWELSPSLNGEYKELVFRTDRRYENVTLRLKDSRLVAEEEWGDSVVHIRSFFVSRVDARNDFEVKNLEPTLFGVSVAYQEILFSEKKETSSDASMWIFQSQGDFLKAIEFSGEASGYGRQPYIFELSAWNQEKKEKEAKVLQRKVFVLDELRDLQVESGNYQIPFLSPLNSGQWYVVTFFREAPKDKEGLFSITSLATDINPDSYTESGDLLLYMSRRATGKNGRGILDQARLEDTGKGYMYFFELQNEEVDYVNLYDASSGIVFDQKKRMVSGKQKNGGFFSYKFDTIYPFDRFVLNATQKGDDEKEIKLEYSFDNTLWKEVSFTQDKGSSQRFSLILPGNRVEHVVYVRVGYNGEEKKSGFFALEALSVNASVGKFR